MAVEKALIEAINRGVDLVALARERGIEVQKNGGSWMGRCPFHEDRTPSLSITPGKNLFQCFGCGAAGDAIRFVELLDKVSFPEAFKALLAAAGPEDPGDVDKGAEAQPLYAPTDHGFIFGSHGRQYEVKGISRSDTQLKAAVKASREVTGGRPFELSTIDLYSSRSRIWFGKLCAELFGAKKE
jgi:hypothetical protein